MANKLDQSTINKINAKKYNYIYYILTYSLLYFKDKNYASMAYCYLSKKINKTPLLDHI